MKRNKVVKQYKINSDGYFVIELRFKNATNCIQIDYNKIRSEQNANIGKIFNTEKFTSPTVR